MAVPYNACRSCLKIFETVSLSTKERSMFYEGLVLLPWWGYLVAALILTHITIASVTIFLHRHQAHRALELHPIASHFFRFWLWLSTGMVTREWVAVHRKHHAKCETPADPHSPQIRGLSAVLLGGVFLYVRASRCQATLAQYGHRTPNDWLERHLYTPLQKVGIVIMLGIDVIFFGAGPGIIIWGIQMFWIPFFAAGVINGLGHCFGYRNFSVPDASANIVPWGILIGGEELHNNHHAYATSARLSAQWYEIDVGWWYIRALVFFHLAKISRVAPRPRLGPVKAECDLGALEAVLALRPYLLAHFDRVVKKRSVKAEEIQALRVKLAALWQRSSHSQEQLLAQLQQWCKEAEASGLPRLARFAATLPRYTLGPLARR